MYDLCIKNNDLFCKLIEALQSFPMSFISRKLPLSNLDLPNYSFVHVNSTTNGNGAAMYISDNLKYKVCENQYQLSNSEALWVNIIDQTDTSYVIGVIYRHPSQILINAFIEHLANCFI